MERKATVYLQYRSKKDIAPIELRLSFRDDQGKRVSHYTQSRFHVEKTFFDEYRKGTNFRDNDKAKLKKEIDGLLTDIRDFINRRLRVTNEPLTPDWFRAAVHDYYNPVEEVENDSVPDGLIPFFDFYLDKKQRELAHGTIKKLRVLRAKLTSFQRDIGRLYKIKDVGKLFLDEFTEWSERMMYDNSVINDNFKDVKTICREARLYNIEVAPDVFFIKSKLRETPPPKIYLSFEELDKIRSIKLDRTKDTARDWLIISCYTGQRISDFKRFRATMIRREGERQFIDIKQQKTGKEVSIPLMPIVEDILDKWGGEFPPTCSDQEYNYLIKGVCRMAGINEKIKGKITVPTEVGNRRRVGNYEKWRLITSHVGRRSFATNYYGKMPTSFLKDITAHGSEAMLLRYIGKTSKDTAVDAYDLMINV